MTRQERCTIEHRDSVQSELGGLVISALETEPNFVHLVVGRPGMPNVELRAMPVFVRISSVLPPAADILDKVGNVSS